MSLKCNQNPFNLLSRTAFLSEVNHNYTGLIFVLDDYSYDSFDRELKMVTSISDNTQVQFWTNIAAQLMLQSNGKLSNASLKTLSVTIWEHMEKFQTEERTSLMQQKFNSCNNTVRSIHSQLIDSLNRSFESVHVSMMSKIPFSNQITDAAVCQAISIL